ncbi:hypothetical protein NDU88_005311 [Pleurodeles waltl]|uniref:Uncharacterized protein n=1 Tax=Pleurodeles waltl TaxID=8319 RepID=A0AAV7PNA1_PLEWA|nr:hypothetical protein NDU88_005311 [Pleurodeles waltl]
MQPSTASCQNFTAALVEQGHSRHHVKGGGGKARRLFMCPQLPMPAGRRFLRAGLHSHARPRLRLLSQAVMPSPLSSVARGRTVIPRARRDPQGLPTSSVRSVGVRGVVSSSPAPPPQPKARRPAELGSQAAITIRG